MQLDEHLKTLGVNDALHEVILGCAEGVYDIAHVVHTGGIEGYAGSQNVFGEDQLKLDVVSNEILIRILGDLPSVDYLASEEMSEEFQPHAEDSTAKYRANIKNIPPLTPEEEVQLIRKFREGEEESKTRLAEANLRIVLDVIELYVGRGLSSTQLIQYGNIGLFRAIEKFDSAEGTSFSTYAESWIRNTIEEALSDWRNKLKSSDGPENSDIPPEFSIAFDPLDGSSLVDVNFAVGTIIGIYPGGSFIGKKPGEMHAVVVAVYGPRTTLFVAIKGKGAHQYLLTDGGFELKQEKLIIADEGKYFAPGNLRACTKNPSYRRLLDYWLDQQYTLRYSGGMVPDVNHILVKGKGVFVYPGYNDEPNGKLRLLYECGTMGFLMIEAGGVASDGAISILDKPVEHLHQRTPIFMGSKSEVEKALEYFIM